MNLFTNLFNNDDEKTADIWGKKFDENQLSRCIIQSLPTKDGKSRIVLNKRGCDMISKKFGDIISLVGLAGNGKSTLASTLYNIMRGDTKDYFAMSNSMASYTQGVWSLQRNKPDKDIINVLDLQGLENKNSVHYMVVVAMALSKAVLLCSINTRFDFSMLDTLAAGFALMEKFKIKLPKPVIYLQAPYSQYHKNQFKINNEMVDSKGLLQFILGECPALKGYDIRIFGLPSFYHEEFNPDGTRFDKKYVNQVKSILDDLAKIPEGVRAKERIQYAITVAKALNSDSPQLVTKLNFFSFEQELALIQKELVTAHTRAMKQLYEQVRLDNKVSKVEFVQRVDYAKESVTYRVNIIKQAKNLAYYDSENKECENLLHSIEKNQNLFENPLNYIEIYYKKAINDVKIRNAAKGDKIIQAQTEQFAAFVKMEISNKIKKITFQGNTNLPYDLDYKIKKEKSDLMAQLMKATDNDAKVPNDYLGIDINARWGTQVDLLKSEWNLQISRAKSRRCEVRTAGNGKCTACGQEHTSMVVHKECKNSDDARWLWVDPPTKYAVCDQCDEMTVITHTVCWTCSHPMDCKVLDPPNQI